MKLTEALFLMNKQINRLKNSGNEKIEHLKKTTIQKQILGIFLKLQKSKLGKEAKLKLLKIGYREYEEMLKEGWEKLIHTRGFCKNKFKLINHF